MIALFAQGCFELLIEDFVIYNFDWETELRIMLDTKKKADIASQLLGVYLAFKL